MAYRPLEVNDRVKIMQKGHVAFGTFGTVLKVDGDLADVKMGDASLWFLQKDLMVASDALHGFYTSSEYYVDRNNYNYPEQLVDGDDEEDYDNWTRDDLIEHIRRLEREIEQLEK